MKDEELYQKIKELANQNIHYKRMDEHYQINILTDSMLYFQRKIKDNTLSYDGDYIGYLFTIIMNNIRRELNKITKEKKKQNLSNDYNNEPNDIDKSIIIKPIYDDIDNLMKDYNPLEQIMLKMLIDGYQLKNIAYRINKPYTTIWHVLRKIRKEKTQLLNGIKIKSKFSHYEYKVRDIKSGEIKIFGNQNKIMEYCNVSCRTLYYGITEERIIKKKYRVTRTKIK